MIHRRYTSKFFFPRRPTWPSYKGAIVDSHLASPFLTQVKVNACWPCFGGSSRYNFVQGRVRCRLVPGPQLAGKRTLEVRGTETTEVEARRVWNISLFGQFLTFLSLAPQIPPQILFCTSRPRSACSLTLGVYNFSFLNRTLSPPSSQHLRTFTEARQSSTSALRILSSWNASFFCLS